MRWKLLLEEYDYEIQYRAGIRNCNIDSLSCYPVQCLTVNTEEITNERKQRIIAEMHNCPVGGHQGIHRTIKRIKLYTSWPNIDKDVTQYVKECKTCQLNKETHPNVKLPLTITDTKATPWDKIYLQGNGPIRHVETCPDFFSLQEYIQQNPLSKF
jgi:transcription elongation factor Elf1